MFRCLSLAAVCIGLQLVDPVSLGLPGSLSLGLQQTTLVYFLKWCLAGWATVEANAVLNSWAENKWIWGSCKNDWDWPNEVAVVTGGSAGIGACAVKKLISHGIRVAVLDVGPLSNQFTDSEQPPAFRVTRT